MPLYSCSTPDAFHLSTVPFTAPTNQISCGYADVSVNTSFIPYDPTEHHLHSKKGKSPPPHHQRRKSTPVDPDHAPPQDLSSGAEDIQSSSSSIPTYPIFLKIRVPPNMKRTSHHQSSSGPVSKLEEAMPALHITDDSHDEQMDVDSRERVFIRLRVPENMRR